MSDPSENMRRGGSAGAGSAAWWLVCQQELTELWLGGRALNLLILFSILMSIMAFLLATNNELSLTPPKLMELITLQAAITFGLFIGLVIAAESVSGERERTTLEGFLLTPTSRRQIIFGKFVAALSPWPVAMLLAIPYMVTLAQGDEVLVPAMLWGSLLGTLLAITFTALGVLVSIWSNSNKISLFVSLLVYLACLLPSQLPGQLQASPALVLVRVIDPVEASNQFLQKVLVNSAPQVGLTIDPTSSSDVWIYLAGCVIATALVSGVLFLYAAPRLRLESQVASILQPIWKRMEAIK